MILATLIARFDANSDRADLNCNRDPDNSNPSLGIAYRIALGHYAIQR